MSYNFAQFPQKCISLVNKCISDIKLVIADTPFNNPDFQDFLISVIQREPFCLQYVSHPTLDMFVAASRYAGALDLVKNRSPEIVNCALRKNTFNKYQLNRYGIKSMQELVRYKVGVDYVPMKSMHLQCILPTYKSLSDFTDHKLDIWSPTKYDLPYVPKPIKKYEDTSQSRELVVEPIEISEPETYDDRVRDMELTDQGVWALIHLYKKKTGIDFSKLTWIPGYKQANNTQRSIIDYMTYALSNSLIIDRLFIFLIFNIFVEITETIIFF
jgi:hypothetical protein